MNTNIVEREKKHFQSTLYTALRTNRWGSLYLMIIVIQKYLVACCCSAVKPSHTVSLYYFSPLKHTLIACEDSLLEFFLETTIEARLPSA